MTIQLPNMLSFERKLEVSDGLMFAGNWDYKNKEYLDESCKHKAWFNIAISPRQNRGTQSMSMKEDKRADTIKPNVVEGDDACLPNDKDTLKLSFSLRIIGNLGKPFACNKPDFSQAIEQKVDDFKNSEGISALAYRYAYNIANGRFLWRNRVGTEEICVLVKYSESSDEEKILTFNAYNFSLNDFDKNKSNDDLKKLAELIETGLKGDENNFTLIAVSAYVKMGDGQHVFPSQEMNMNEKKKKLFQLDGCAAMHNVKIGNAVRTIDTWYGDTMLVKTQDDNGKDKIEEAPIDPEKYPVAIEPYGSVTQHGRAYRHKDIDLYTLMFNWVNDDIAAEQKRYVVANLIRGGVFGGKD